MLKIILGSLLTLGLVAGCSGDNSNDKSNKGNESSASSVAITASGSTFAYPVMSKWAERYNQLKNVQINYQATGSGAGIRQIQERIIDFAASDTPLTSAELDKHQLIQFPLVLGGIAIVVNLENIKPGELVLDGPTLADIFSSKIKKWNDPAITKLNPGVNLPDLTITVVHRSDGSGTTYNFTDYLAKVSPSWKEEIGVGTMVKWKGDVGSKGNAGIAAYTGRVPGAIGYVEYAYAHQKGLSWVKMYNLDGKMVSPGKESFAAKWQEVESFNLLLTNQPGVDSWPITASVFILLPKVGKDDAKTEEILAFFDWLYKDGQATAIELEYVPLPQDVYKLVTEYWSTTLKNGQGKAIWPNQSKLSLVTEQTTAVNTVNVNGASPIQKE